MIKCRICFDYFPTFIESLTRYLQEHPHLKDDLRLAMEQLEGRGFIQREAVGMGVYKIRIPLRDQNIGARGGGRLLLFRHGEFGIPFLFYLKSEFKIAPEDLLRSRLTELRAQIDQQPPLPLSD